MTEINAPNNKNILTSNFKEVITQHIEEIQYLYKSDEIPWVLGYSGGKDSTAIVQLVWNAIKLLRPNERSKPIYVISTDTLVENPVVSGWVNTSLKRMAQKAEFEGLPIKPIHLTPALEDTFWVNLIGKGYPSPRPKFRWCTERLKIRPVDRFIRETVGEHGEAIVVLGTRKSESAARSARLTKYENLSRRDFLSNHTSIESAFVYAPISDWSNDDVWLYLMQVPNPWDNPNKDLLTMYQGASADGECPLVVDTTTPSCGSSRFGCWVCTLVDEDKSMTAMIQNDDEKSWMLPLLKLRNELDEHDHDKREFKRLNGSVALKHNVDELVPGPYTQDSRASWLTKLLTVQEAVKNNPETPDFMKDFEIITLNELHEIRRIWIVEKFEIEDFLPKIYEKVTHKKFPDSEFDQSQPFGEAELLILKDDICENDELKFSLLRNLLEIERRYRSSRRRSGLIQKLEQALKQGSFESENAALSFAIDRRDRKNLTRQIRESELTNAELQSLTQQFKTSS